MKNQIVPFIFFAAFFCSCNGGVSQGESMSAGLNKSEVLQNDGLGRINVDIKNMTDQDFAALKNIESTGAGESCVAKSDAAIGAVKSDIACTKSKRLTDKGKAQLADVFEKYGYDTKSVK